MSPAGPVGGPWLVLREGERRRWGGDLRRRYLLDGLVERTSARVVDDWRPATIRATLEALHGPAWRLRRRTAAVASTELLSEPQLAAVTAGGRATLIDVHDHPLVQNEALGILTPRDEATDLARRITDNLDAFAWHVAQSVTFIDVAGMDADRTLVAPNGCDPRHIDRRPLPAGPVVGYVSGAAPGRGIETLIEAVRLARSTQPELVLRLWLVATGEASRVYLEGLRATVADDPWVTIESVAYADLPAALAQASVLCVPNPPSAYWDAVLPIKLFDSLAAGRPVVVTPRLEQAALVRKHGVGLVTTGDRPEDLAAAFVRLSTDGKLAEELGAAARRAAEEHFDWLVVGRRLADDLLARVG